MASDNFNRANNTSLGAGWAAATDGSAQIVGDQVQGVGSNSGNVRTGETYAADQSSQLTLETIASPNWVGVTVRSDATSANHYLAIAFNNAGTPTLMLFIRQNGTWGQLGSSVTVPAFTAGDTLKLDVTGNTLSLIYNGVTKISLGDNTFSTGAPGIYFANGATADDWVSTGDSTASPQTVNLTGLDSAVAFGTESITTTVTVNVTGLNSPRAFGSITTQGGAITFLVAVSGGRFYHRRGAIYEQFELAPSGSTGDNTHAGVHVGGGQEALVFQFVAETVGASPTVTWKVQGSPDDPSLLDDASANWYDVGYVTDSSDTISQATRTRTSEGGDIAFLANPVARRFQRYRLVVTGNTNVTYRAEMFRVSSR